MPRDGTGRIIPQRIQAPERRVWGLENDWKQLISEGGARDQPCDGWDNHGQERNGRERKGYRPQRETTGLAALLLCTCVQADRQTDPTTWGSSMRLFSGMLHWACTVLSGMPEDFLVWSQLTKKSACRAFVSGDRAVQKKGAPVRASGKTELTHLSQILKIWCLKFVLKPKMAFFPPLYFTKDGRDPNDNFCD